MEKLIITVAHTGNVPTKEMNPYTPVTVKEIVDDIEACAALGASVAHIHVRDENQMPTSRRDLFAQVLDGIKQRKVPVITQLSTGARGGENTAQWRGQMLDLPADMASLSTGSSNFPSSVNANSPQLVEELAKKMQDNGIVPEIEAFDLAMISNAKWLLKKGILKAPLHFNLVMNVRGSIEGTPKNLMYMVDSLPEGSTWCLTAVGRCHLTLAAMAIAMGGNIRTGLEDVIEIQRGVPVCNIELVKHMVKIAEAVGRPVADAVEARRLLSL